MIELIKATDYQDRKNKGKKAWALACEEQQRREIKDIIKESKTPLEDEEQ